MIGLSKLIWGFANQTVVIAGWRSQKRREGPPMNRTQARTFLTHLTYYSVDLQDFAGLSCRGCRSLLDLHQPDSNQSEQFLGTCTSCGCWYRIETSGEDGRITVLQLPTVAEIHQPPLPPRPQS